MSWQLDPNSGTYQWVDDGQGDPTRQPTYDPKTGGAAAPTQPQLGTAAHAGAGGAQAVQTQTPQQRANAALREKYGNTPGMAYFEDANGVGSFRVVDETAYKTYQATQGPNATRQPGSGGPVIDPATGKPLGQAPAAPAAPQTVQQQLAAAGTGRTPALGPAPTGARSPLQSRTPQAGAVTRVQQQAGQMVRDRLAADAQPGAAGPGGGFSPVQADYSRYDAAARDLAAARDTFQGELTRLSGVDPFGNQAFLQKATDRAVAQAAGTAAGARGGAAALAGANRQAVGVQSQLAARGIQDMEAQKAQDARAASGLRLQAAAGVSDLAQAGAQNEIALGDQAVRVGEANLQAAMQKYGIDANIGQQERESLRQLGVAMAQVDMQRYATDMDYRQSVDQGIIQKYVSDNQLAAAMAQIEAQENLSPAEVAMGLLGMGGGLAQAAIMAPVKSDRRSKTAFRAARTSELKEYLTSAPGSHYRYRNPDAPGQRKGENFGPMAQDLAKTKIGRTVVVEGRDGLYVDSARLALVDHAALTHLAQRVERLAARVSRKTK